MSVYGEQNLLLKLQSTLLSAGDERKNPGYYALFRPQDASLSSCSGGVPYAFSRKGKDEQNMSGKKILYLSLGILGLGLGALGAVLPLLPAFPFLMLAAFCFGRSSEKLDRWFKSTKLYQNNLETYVKGQGMTWKTKIRVMVIVTLLMVFGFLIMFQKALYIPCAILGAVWLFHILYFCFGVKNYAIKEESVK